jgi:DNA-directed RNA polymerase specialized sigma24 family protein
MVSAAIQARLQSLRLALTILRNKHFSEYRKRAREREYAVELLASSMKGAAPQRTVLFGTLAFGFLCDQRALQTARAASSIMDYVPL